MRIIRSPPRFYVYPYLRAGFRKVINHLDGREVPVRFTGVTQPFEVRRIEEEGMPMHNTPSQRGTLFVKYIVDLPPTLNSEQIAAVEKLFV